LLTAGFSLPRPPADADGWLAPAAARTTTVRPTPVAPSDPVDVLDELAEQVEGTRAALLASVDGFGIARSRSMTDDPSHAAMLAAAVGLAQQLTSMGGGSHLRQLVVDHDGGLMIVWPVGSQRVLAVMATSRVDQRQLRNAVQRHGAVLAGATS
jgi:predicted regulator of Ras-like GTPase activity (Roadblock/LC7/MglB family)